MNQTSNKNLERSLEKNSWHFKECDDLKLIFSPLLAGEPGLIHAFTTRHRGDSPSPVDSFNLGRHLKTDQSRMDALKNRKRLCQALGVDFDRMVVPGQVHSSTVVLSEKTGGFADIDGIATNTRKRPILLHFADCVPVIIYDPKTVALAIVHAGWKGTAGQIAKNGVAILSSEFGCRPADMLAAVGPAIGSCCYPTGEEVAVKLGATAVEAGQLIEYCNGQPHPDLKAINALQLLEAGVGQVDVTALCTACDPETFYSHRQSGGKTGRQGAIGCLG